MKGRAGSRDLREHRDIQGFQGLTLEPLGTLDSVGYRGIQDFRAQEFQGTQVTRESAGTPVTRV